MKNEDSTQSCAFTLYIARNLGPEMESLQIAELAPSERTGFTAKEGSSTKKALRVRKEFPETWLWIEEKIRFV